MRVNFPTRLSLLLFLVGATLGSLPGRACSMCKVTLNGRTYLGNNEDSWRRGAQISFINAPPGQLGALYLSYGDGFPQGAMNQAGLAFDGLTIYKENLRIDPAKKAIPNFEAFVRTIMQTCQTVEQVERYARDYSRAIVRNGELFFADKRGHYLIMEPDTMILGTDQTYLIANFCPSVTPETERLAWDRYRRGRDYITTHPLVSSPGDYCLALVKAMHERRPKLGDGTLYSTVADLQSGELELYFYHDYRRSVRFNLSRELAKGDHRVGIGSLFPLNTDYDRLVNYKVPQNDSHVLGFLLFCGGLFAGSAVYFSLSYVMNRKASGRTGASYRGYQLGVAILNVALGYFMYLLVRNPAFFYSPAPYQDFRFSSLTVAAYLPFVLLVVLVPLVRVNRNVLKDGSWWRPTTFLLTLNILVYLILVVWILGLLLGVVTAQKRLSGFGCLAPTIFAGFACIRFEMTAYGMLCSTKAIPQYVPDKLRLPISQMRVF